MQPLVVLTTVGASFDAHALAKALVEQRLAACVSVLPQVMSHYRWNDAVESGSEQLLIIKTTAERLDRLRDELFRLHPYEVPEFVVLEAGIEGPYRDWLQLSTS